MIWPWISRKWPSKQAEQLPRQSLEGMPLVMRSWRSARFLGLLMQKRIGGFGEVLESIVKDRLIV